MSKIAGPRVQTGLMKGVLIGWARRVVQLGRWTTSVWHGVAWQHWPRLLVKPSQCVGNGRTET